MIMNDLLMWVAAILVFAGSAVTLVAALGVLRLPDFFMRMHAATKAGVVGPSLILAAAGFFEPSIATWITILFTILFLLTTTPISGHLIARAGFIGGVGLWGKTIRNDLETILPPSQFIEIEDSETTRQVPADMMTDPRKAGSGS